MRLSIISGNGIHSAFSDNSPLSPASRDGETAKTSRSAEMNLLIKVYHSLLLETFRKNINHQISEDKGPESTKEVILFVFYGKQCNVSYV